MRKIDKRKNYYMVVDTETYGHMGKPIVFDIGAVIIDKKGHIYERFSYLVAEAWYDEHEAVKTAFYFEPNKASYYKALREKQITIKKFFGIRKILLDKIDEYGIKAIIAHNMPFDYRALNGSTKKWSRHGLRYFFPKMPLYCTLKMARQIYGKRPSYDKFCHMRPADRITPTGKLKLTAEVVFQYVSGMNDFVEAHTGLADAEIESYIFSHIMRQKQKLDKEINTKGSKKKWKK